MDMDTNIEMRTDQNAKKKKKKKSKTGLWIAIVLVFILCSAVFGAAIGIQFFLNSIEEKDAAYIVAMSKKGEEVNLPSALRSYSADKVSQKEKMPHYSNSEIRSMDLSKPSGVTEDDLRQVLSRGLTGLEDAFVEAEETYGVNCVFLASIASHESAYATRMFAPNNMFGYGRSGFSSKEECIMTVAKTLGTKYLSPGGSLYSGTTIKDVNRRYAADSSWNVKVADYMTNYYAVITDYHNNMIDSMDRLV